MINLNLNTVKKTTSNANVLKEWISIAPNIIMVISGSSELDYNFPIQSTSSRSISASYADKVKTINTPITYSIGTSSWSEKSKTSLTASYISGRMCINGTDGYYPRFDNNSFTKESSIFESGGVVRITAPVISPNIPSKVETSPSTLTLDTKTFIPIVINGKIYKLALLQ